MFAARDVRGYALAALLFLLVAGCSSIRPLVDTPTLYAAGAAYPDNEIPDGLKTPFADILYVTDRRQAKDEKGRPDYDAGRSRSVAFGSVTVEIGKEATWPSIVKASQSAERKKKIPLTVRSVDELARYPETPLPFTVVNGNPQTDAAALARYDDTNSALREEIRTRLASAGSNEVLLFVPGFNTPFDEAAFITTEIWHFAGRRGVPLVYSWPSGSGGAFGYFTDRESGEFTIFHLKEFLRLIAATPEIERVNIISHSRGSDIVATALRELVIESRAAGRDPSREYRIDNLIMAAPDLDFGVVEQRLIAERLGAAFGRITIYASEKDSALKVSQWLMKGTRFGRIRAENLSDADAEIFSSVKNIDLINVESPHGVVAHSYFRKDPAVLSDIITLIRGGGAPSGSERPLEKMRFNFWRLPKDYLNQTQNKPAPIPPH